jgi:hypothetical protein
VIQVDATAVTRGMRQLAAGLDRVPPRTGLEQATDTASRIRGQVPVRSGRLAHTVQAVRVPNGGAVTYGGGLPYAHYIEGRSHAVADGIAGAPEQFHGRMEHAAAREVNAL